jgi:hypothetical protein
MALPPTIPTSFVPKQPLSAVRKKAGTNFLLLGACIILGLALLAALAAFGYKAYLTSARDAKAAELAAAQKDIDMDAIEDFVRLRNRLRSATTIINQHILLSRFFAILETRSLQSVQFKSLDIKVSDTRTAQIRAGGIARSFNALAAQSAAFAAEKRIKSAIFSEIGPEKDGTIHFSLTAELDPRLITENGEGAFAAPSDIPAAPVQTVPATSTSTSTPASSSPTTL